MTQNNIATQVAQIFKQRRLDAVALAKSTLQTALADNDFKTAFYNIRSLQFELSKPNQTQSKLKQLNAEIKQQKALLQTVCKKLGVSKQDFLTQYSCKRCNDTGFIKKQQCSCSKKEYTNLFLQQFNIDTTKLPTFAKVDFAYCNNDKDIVKIYDLAQSFVDNIETNKKLNMIISGGTGIGKTYLTQCMLSLAIQNNLFTNYYTALNLNQLFLQYHLAKLQDKTSILNQVLNCELLIIDDLGSENILQNVTVEYLYLLLEHRASNNKRTVITTNHSPEEIQDKYQDRVFSRIFNKKIGVAIEMKGENLRFKK